MKQFLEKWLFVSLLPSAFICFQYNQCHGYFAESYEVLGSFLAIIGIINVLFLVVKLDKKLIFSIWLTLFLPNFVSVLWLDFFFKCIFCLSCFFLLKRVPLRIVMFVCLLVFVFNSFQIVQRDCNARSVAYKKINNFSQHKSFVRDKNIYWIVLDAYTSADVLRNYYHLDNSEFYRQLQSLGFLIQDGQLPYKEINSFPTLKALNFYANFNTFDVTKTNALILHYGLKNSLLFTSIRNSDYTLFSNQSRFPFLHKLRTENLLPFSIITSLQFLYHCFKQNQLFAYRLALQLNKQLYIQQEKLFKSLESNWPTADKSFYYFHIESPHAPFVRDEKNCFINDQKSVVWGENEIGKNAYRLEDYQAGYVRQLIGLNQRIITLLQCIIQKDPHALIVIQGDHGTFTTDDYAEQRAFLFATRNAPFSVKNPETFWKQLIYGE